MPLMFLEPPWKEGLKTGVHPYTHDFKPLPTRTGAFLLLLPGIGIICLKATVAPQRHGDTEEITELL